MGVLNFETEPYHRRKITDALRRRGLIPDLEEGWDVHGPHENMNFQVYVGYAMPRNDLSDCFCVAISLHGLHRGVYERGRTRIRAKIAHSVINLLHKPVQ